MDGTVERQHHLSLIISVGMLHIFSPSGSILDIQVQSLPRPARPQPGHMPRSSHIPEAKIQLNQVEVKEFKLVSSFW